jgi:hypothetical protein
MLAEVQVPFADVRAAGLALALDVAPQPALGTLVVPLGPLTLELRILGASHQVVARGEDVWLTETVACVPGRQGALPARADAAVGGLRHRFTSTIETLDGPALAARAAAIRARAEADRRALAGVFPGAPGALTAIVLEDDGWQTWHAYPQTGELVTTRTAVAA